MSSAAVSSGVALSWARAQFEAAGSASPLADARLLLAHALGTDPSRLALVTTIEGAAADRFTDLVRARAQGTPVQHLTGRAPFRTIELEVGPGVFVPRPETEVMVGWALEQISPLPAPVVVDLCTGSGAIALAIATEAPSARVHAVELDPAAVGFAQRNLAASGVDLREGDMAEAFHDLDGQADLVISNPPYIPLEAWEGVPAQVRDHDPHLALFSGQDGLDALRVVERVAARLLKPGALVCAEHAEVQEDAAPEVFVARGNWQQVRDHRDLLGRPRFVTAVRAGVGR